MYTALIQYLPLLNKLIKSQRNFFGNLSSSFILLLLHTALVIFPLYQFIFLILPQVNTHSGRNVSNPLECDTKLISNKPAKSSEFALLDVSIRYANWNLFCATKSLRMNCASFYNFFFQTLFSKKKIFTVVKNTENNFICIFWPIKVTWTSCIVISIKFVIKKITRVENFRIIVN